MIISFLQHVLRLRILVNTLVDTGKREENDVADIKLYFETRGISDRPYVFIINYCVTVHPVVIAKLAGELRLYVF